MNCADLLIGQSVYFPIDKTFKNVYLDYEVIIQVKLIDINLVAVLIEQLLVHHVETLLGSSQIKNGAEYFEKVLFDVVRIIRLI